MKTWDELTEKERKKLHNDQAYQEQALMDCELIASSPERAVPALGESKERPMGPNKSVTCHSQSELRVITSATPELKSDSEGLQDLWGEKLI